MLGIPARNGGDGYRRNTAVGVFVAVLAMVVNHPADAWVAFVADTFVDIAWDSTCTAAGPCCDGAFQYYAVRRGGVEITRVTTPAASPDKNVYRDTDLTPNRTYRYSICCQTDRRRTCDTISGDPATPGGTLSGTLYRDATFSHGEYGIDAIVIEAPATLYLHDVQLHGAHNGPGHAAIAGQGGSLQIDRANILEVGLGFGSSGTNFLRNSLVDWPAGGPDLLVLEQTHADLTDNPGIRGQRLDILGTATISNNSFYGDNAPSDFDRSFLHLTRASTVQGNRFYRAGISTFATGTTEIRIVNNTFIGGASDWYADDVYQSAGTGWLNSGEITANTFDAVEKPPTLLQVGAHIGGVVTFNDNTVRGLDGHRRHPGALPGAAGVRIRQTCVPRATSKREMGSPAPTRRLVESREQQRLDLARADVSHLHPRRRRAPGCPRALRGAHVQTTRRPALPAASPTADEGFRYCGPRARRQRLSRSAGSLHRSHGWQPRPSAAKSGRCVDRRRQLPKPGDAIPR